MLDNCTQKTKISFFCSSQYLSAAANVCLDKINHTLFSHTGIKTNIIKDKFRVEIKLAINVSLTNSSDNIVTERYTGVLKIADLNPIIYFLQLNFSKIKPMLVFPYTANIIFRCWTKMVLINQLKFKFSSIQISFEYITSPTTILYTELLLDLSICLFYNVFLSPSIVVPGPGTIHHS
jgi:hypothetical protein